MNHEDAWKELKQVLTKLAVKPFPHMSSLQELSEQTHLREGRRDALKIMLMIEEEAKRIEPLE